MMRKYLVNDMRRSRLITAVIALFILLAALLTSTAIGLFAQLAGSIDRMMTAQKTPHFLQMHAGTADKERIAAFAAENPAVEAWQVQDFLNLDGSQIRIQDAALIDTTQDNGLVVQSEAFDWLVDEQGAVIQPEPGTIWLPLLYRQDGTAKTGDPVRIGAVQLTVAGFLRDSQMNSALAGSKRLLVAPEDFEKVKDTGVVESLISFRIKEGASLQALETAYQEADLPANGPTVTYPLFRIMNGISDGILIAVFMLAAVLVVLIAFLCIRFTLLAQMEDDYREIGTMKAIGMRTTDIRNIYLSKYAFLAGISALAGYLLSLPVSALLSENIRLHMGAAKQSLPVYLAALAGAVLIFLILLLYVNRVLQRFRHISASEAIRYGAPDENTGRRKWKLSKTALPVNLFIGANDVFLRARLYTTMALVVILSAFLLIVPQNIHSTISSRSFITYNGIGDTDLMLSIQQTGQIADKEAVIASDLARNPHVEQYAVLSSRLFAVQNEEKPGRIKVDTGDHSVFPINYTEGRAPVAENEIALSGLNAEDYQKKVGDRITLDVDGTARELIVSGIYSDITNGGKTAKARFTSQGEILWSTVYVGFRESADIEAQKKEMTARYPYAKIAEISEYFTRMTATLTQALHKASMASVAITVSLVFLVTLLFVRMLLAKNRSATAVLKVLGFTHSDLRLQYLSRTLLVGGLGVLMGIFLANTAGESVGTALIRSFGVAKLHFRIRPLLVFGLYPAMLLFVIYLATRLGTARITEPDLSMTLKE